MSDSDLVNYLCSLGLVVEAAQDTSGSPFIVIRNVILPIGDLAGTTCDIALACCRTIPYVVPPAVHTRPALVAMDMIGPHKTQASSLGSDWQYWSRRFDRPPSPQAVWTHILTVLTEVTLP